MLIDNREVSNLVQELLHKCGKSQNSPLTTPTGECPWDVFETIYDTVQKLMDKQSTALAASSVVKKNEGDIDIKFSKFIQQPRKVEEFREWMIKSSNNNCGLNKFIELSVEHESGFEQIELVACSKVEQDDKVLTIPRKCMMVGDVEISKCGDNAEHGNVITKLFKSDQRLFTEVPSLKLTMVLLYELFENKEKSKWRHYINVLPKQYLMVLYFSKPSFKNLHLGSSSGELTLSLYRNISRQYCLIFSKLASIAPKSNLAQNFSYEAFRWAVCTVMSRQNKIPSGKVANGKTMQSDQLALIPLWDLANHKQSHMTTFYNSETNTIECLATEGLEIGDKFEIHYGNRTNSSFMMYQGFVPDKNIHNQVTVTLGISSKDSLCRTKSQILLDHQIPSCGKFSLHTSYHEIPFTRDLLIFSRVFNLDKDELGLVMIQKDLVEKRYLGNLMFGVTQNHEIKVWKFLSTRCSLLEMKADKVKKKIEEWINDETITRLEKTEAELVLKLVKSELEIYENVKGFAERMLKTVQTDTNAFTFLDSV
ncbi:actin-histidine N-methyltransferase-like [Convolutriloba macropyga]|uniref:actin-histidine N-methyltransferase-like n=1 Tax=Convolutriloba macropyga TaxID=536237 RepID=UPI003F526495